MINLPVAKNARRIVDHGAVVGVHLTGTRHAVQARRTRRRRSTSRRRCSPRASSNDAPQSCPARDGSRRRRNTSAAASRHRVQAGDIYEFSYTAKDPTVNGIGFAAVRDFVAFLRFADRRTIPATPNPLAGDIQRVYSEVLSQPGRMFNDFRNLGFNQAEDGKKVFDGHMQWIAAADGINLNYRFSQPGRTERNRQDHLYVEGVFPFANESSTDHITGKTAGRYDRCTQTDTCPFAVEIYSANEYWVKAASLFHTSTTGTSDLPGHPMTRLYLVSSMQHGAGNGNNAATASSSRTRSTRPRSSARSSSRWTGGPRTATPPPASRVPRIADGTLVAPLPQTGMGFPNIPGVTYNGLKTTRYLFNYGPRFDDGHPGLNPPMVVAAVPGQPAERPDLPQHDSEDRRATATISRACGCPRCRVPLNTYTGWALRARASARTTAAKARGSAFRSPPRRPRVKPPAILACRSRSGIPSFQNYYYQVTRAVNDFAAEGFLLTEDAAAMTNRMLNAGFATGVISLSRAPCDRREGVLQHSASAPLAGRRRASVDARDISFVLHGRSTTPIRR